MFGLDGKCVDGDEPDDVPSHKDKVDNVVDGAKSGGKTKGVDGRDGVGAPSLKGETLGTVLVGEDFGGVETLKGSETE